MEATALSTVIADIGTVLTGILGFIPDIFATLFEIAIVKYVLYASLAVAVIVFVWKLLSRIRGRRKI